VAPRSKYEVHYTLTGQLGPYSFERAWYYWIIHGLVPLFVAEEMYRNPIGRYDVRARGHCGCPPLDTEADTIKGARYVLSYHIDSQEGLNLFCETIRRYGLDHGMDPKCYVQGLLQRVIELEQHLPNKNKLQAQDLEHIKATVACYYQYTQAKIPYGDPRRDWASRLLNLAYYSARDLNNDHDLDWCPPAHMHERIP